MENNIFTPEAFGAAADGIHNDNAAIAAAIKAAAECSGTVKFGKNKVYYVKDGVPTPGGNAVMYLNNADGVSIIGENSVIRTGEVMAYFNFFASRNIVLKGFIFETQPHCAFRGRLVSVNNEKVSAIIKTDTEPEFANDFYKYYDYEKVNAHPYSFAIPDSQWREHLFLRRIDRISPKTCEVWFATDFATRNALRYVGENRCDIIMPTPRMSHAGCAVLIHGCANVHIEDCNIKEAPQFVCAVKGNQGDIYFDNVKMCCESDQEIPTVGWRDGYHCKDNRGAIHWKNCDIGRLYDDAFNISCTCLYVDAQPDENTLSLKNFENNGVYYSVRKGDALSVYDTFEGKIISEFNRVKRVIKQCGAELLIELENPISEVDFKHTRVMFDSLSAPGSTVENCRVYGTVRMRGPITVRDTDFNLLMMWFENEDHIEGPVPRDMLFENCRFKGSYPVTDRYLENYLSFRTVKAWPGVPEYKLKNIKLSNCRLDSRFTYVEEDNDVMFENCCKLEGKHRKIPERL